MTLAEIDDELRYAINHRGNASRLLIQQLKEYMVKNGHKDLVLYVKKGQGCCSASMRMVQARFAKEEDEALVEKGYVAVESELGKIYYDMERIVLEQNPELIFNRIFGKVVIQPMGMHVDDARFDMACSLADMRK